MMIEFADGAFEDESGRHVRGKGQDDRDEERSSDVTTHVGGEGGDEEAAATELRLAKGEVKTRVRITKALIAIVNG
jgi:hypothetical protein